MLALPVLSGSLVSEDTDEHEYVFLPHVASSDLPALSVTLLQKRVLEETELAFGSTAPFAISFARLAFLSSLV